MRVFFVLFAAGVALLSFVAGACSKDRAHISGSSTVFPYAEIVVNSFHELYPEFKTPVVESGGSGAGIKEFCSGIDLDTIDIANASRPINAAELRACAAAGVKDIEQILFGYDGIVFASDAEGPSWALSVKDLYLALAAQHVMAGKLVANKFSKWSEIDKNLPNFKILAYIPGEKHGTREVFEEKVLLAGCKESGAAQALKQAGLDAKQIHAACVAVRKDGPVVDIDGDYAETLMRLSVNKNALGVFGLSYYENNSDKLKVASVEGVIPTVQTVASGQYIVSRPLYFYVKKAHLARVKGLKEYIDYFLSNEMLGPDGALVAAGLVPLPPAQIIQQRKDFAGGKIMPLP